MSHAVFKNVSKRYGSVVALKDVSFEVHRGEVLALLGPNGAGKSTSLQVLVGLRSASSGQVEVLGGDPRRAEVRRKLGITPQDLDFPSTLTAGEILHMVAVAYGVPGEMEVARRLGLSDLLERRSLGLSGGERRRLGLACALISSPELLILDEPTTGLDVESRRLLWDLIREEKKKGTTIVLTTHYLEEVEELADRVLIIDRGQVIFAGPIPEMKALVDYHRIEFLKKTGGLPQAWAVDSFEERSSGHVVAWSRSSDQALRQLVEARTDFNHLTITAASLEDAFIQLRKRSL